MVEPNQELEVAVAKLMGYTAKQGWGITERGEWVYDDFAPHTYGNGWQVVAPGREFEREEEVYPTEEEAWTARLYYYVRLQKGGYGAWYDLPFDSLQRLKDGTYLATKDLLGVHCSNPARAVLECIWRHHLGEVGLVEVDYDAMYQAWVEECERERPAPPPPAPPPPPKPFVAHTVTYTLKVPSAETVWYPLDLPPTQDWYGDLNKAVQTILPAGCELDNGSLNVVSHPSDDLGHGRMRYVGEGLGFVWLRIKYQEEVTQ